MAYCARPVTLADQQLEIRGEIEMEAPGMYRKRLKALAPNLCCIAIN